MHVENARLCGIVDETVRCSIGRPDIKGIASRRRNESGLVVVSVAHHVSCMHQTLEGFDTISKGEDFEQNDIDFLRS